MVGPRRCGKCRHLLKAGNAYHCFAPYQCDKQDVDPSWMARPMAYISYGDVPTEPAPMRVEYTPAQRSTCSDEVLGKLSEIDGKLDAIIQDVMPCLSQET